MRQTKGRSRFRPAGPILAATAAFLSLLSAASGATITWKAGTTGDWAAAGNWVGESVPGDGDRVEITNSGSGVLLSSSSSNLSSLLLSQTLTFTNWNTVLRASSVTVLAGGQMRVAAWSTNGVQSNNLYVSCGTLSVSNGAAINATARGYPGVTGGDGLGPGGGTLQTMSGSYGGRGYGNPKSTYGSVEMPLDPGSAGGGGGTSTGGAGGGAIRIEASGDVTVDGSVVADGAMPAGSASAGSGGSVYIICDRLLGSGLISAAGEGDGINGNFSKGGGGGRIAVIYNTTSQAGVAPCPPIVFRATSGLSAASTGLRFGEPGTLYLPDNYFLRSPFRHTVQWMAPSATNLSFDSLLLTNACLWLRAESVNLTVSNDVRLVGTNIYLHQLRMTAAVVRVGGNLSVRTAQLVFHGGAASGVDLACSSNLVLEPGAQVHVYSGPTNAMGPDYGALLSATGELSVASGAVLHLYCHTTNGGGPLVQARRVTVASGGSVDASGSGYVCGTNFNGYGPGGGSAANREGGGYGGRGGKGGAVYGRTYGEAERPVNAGSAGGGYSGALGYGGAGGGVIRIHALDTMTVNGTNSADGVSGETSASGGSGGTIWLRCKTWAGSGSLSARGAAGSAFNGSGGGGGRIAVWRVFDAASVNVSTSVAAGVGVGVGGTGDVGTVVMGGLPELAGAPAGQTAPVEDGATTSLVFALWNSGLDTNDLFWTASSACPWMTFPNSGVIATGATNTFEVTNSPVGLTPGWHTGVVTFAATSVVSGLSLTPIQTNLTVVLGVYVGSPTPTVQFRPATSSGDESMTPVAMTVVLDTPTPQAVTVEYSVTGGSATGGGEDYTLAAGTLTINPGAISSNINLIVVDDLQDETNASETVVVTLSHAVSATVGTASNYTHAIVDNDNAVWVAPGGVSNWFDSANWAGGFLPVEGNDVVIAGAGVTVLLTDTTPVLNSLTMSGGTLIFSNQEAAVRASNVWIRGGIVRHAANSDTNGADGWQVDGRVLFQCTNFFLSGVINVDGRGWGSPGSGSSTTRSYGPGAGAYRAGGGYGGFGGNAGDNGGDVYGTATEPAQPGSGGGPDTSTAGGSGGGLVRIDAAGTATINGTISANGSTSVRGAGSGGGIWISCRVFAATNATIRANGGGAGSSAGGGGGGGRIAICYDPSAQAVAAPVQATITASRGLVTSSGYYHGDIGTIYVPDAALLGERLNSIEGQICGPSFWGPTNLAVSNVWVRFAQDGFTLAVSNNLTVEGSSGRLEMGGGYIMPRARGGWVIYSHSMDGSGTVMLGQRLYSEAASTLTCGGKLTLTNGGWMRVYSGPTNEPSGYGALVDVKGDASIHANSWVFPVSNPTNGGSPLFRMKNLTIASGNSGFNAIQSGYSGGGGSRQNGYGPGGGGSSAGGGYGGAGGNSGGGTYGSSNAPVHPGSGGGREGATTTYAAAGGAGGGLIRLEISDLLVLNGTLDATGGIGQDDGARRAGTGAGGGIYLRSRRLRGGGVLAANGARVPYITQNIGSGGGGRIAVIGPPTNDFTGALSVNPGAAKAGYAGATGTIVWVQAPAAKGMTLIVR